MPYIYLTYTRDAAPCPTFGGRTAEAGAADRTSTGRDVAHSSLFTIHSSLLPPPRPSENYDFKGILSKSGLGQRPYRGFWRGGRFFL